MCASNSELLIVSFLSDGNSEEMGPEKGARGAWLSGTPLHWVANSHSVAHDAYC